MAEPSVACYLCTVTKSKSQLGVISRVMSYLGPDGRRCTSGHLMTIDTIVDENRKGYPRFAAASAGASPVAGTQHAGVPSDFTRSSLLRVTSNSPLSMASFHLSQIGKERRHGNDTVWPSRERQNLAGPGNSHKELTSDKCHLSQ